MPLIHTQGLLTWKPSLAEDVTSYRVYQGTEDAPPTYDSPSVDVGNVTRVNLPIAGLPTAEGRMIYAVVAVDSVGNVSDLAPLREAIMIDVTPPDAPTEVNYSRDF